MNSLGFKLLGNLFNSLFNKLKMMMRLLIWQKRYLIYRLGSKNIRKSWKNKNVSWKWINKIKMNMRIKLGTIKTHLTNNKIS